MRALVLDSDRIALQEDRPQPVPGDDEVLVRVLTAGICETDLQLMQGYMGFQGVLGHEFVGIAESGKHAGQRVVGEINCACGSCYFCRDGLTNHCPARSVIGILNHDGAFADYVTVPETNLHPVPDSLSNDVAVFTEPLAAAIQITEQLDIEPEMIVIVLGDGRLGNLCAQVLNQEGCIVYVVGKHESKLELLTELSIAVHLRGQTEPERVADLVVDCTGSASGFTDALAWVKPRGTIVLKTTVAAEQTLSLAQIVIDEIRVIGSRCGPFDKALSALAANLIQVEPLISHRFPLSQAVEALHLTRTKPVLKVLLEVRAE